MRRVVKFHLTGRDAEYAVAFENHCYTNLGVAADLSEIVKRQFMNFVYTAAREGEAVAGRPASSTDGAEKETTHVAEVGVDPGDTQSMQDQSPGTTSNPEAGQTGDVTDPVGSPGQ